MEGNKRVGQGEREKEAMVVLRVRRCICGVACPGPWLDVPASSLLSILID